MSYIECCYFNVIMITKQKMLAAMEQLTADHCETMDLAPVVEPCMDAPPSPVSPASIKDEAGVNAVVAIKKEAGVAAEAR